MTTIDAKAIHDQIDFGFEVEAFLGSRIGKYLIGRAEEEIADAVDALKTIDPMKPDEVRALQNRIYRAESIQFWMAEAIQQGENAQRELIEQE